MDRVSIFQTLEALFRQRNGQGQGLKRSCPMAVKQDQPEVSGLALFYFGERLTKYQVPCSGRDKQIVHPIFDQLTPVSASNYCHHYSYFVNT